VLGGRLSCLDLALAGVILPSLEEVGSSRHSPVEPVDITAVIDLPQIVKVPERQRIEILDLRISLER
jgi:hypothetical protein